MISLYKPCATVLQIYIIINFAHVPNPEELPVKEEKTRAAEKAYT